jgi:hypothetical protein
MADETILLSLTDLAALPSMPSQTTLRQIIRDNPDFPVVSWGKHGIAHEIDLALAVEWFARRSERLQEQERAASDKLGQFALELLGPDSAAAFSRPGLSLVDRRYLAEAELLQLKVCEQRSKYVTRESVAEACTAVLEIVTAQAAGAVDRLAEFMDVTPAMRATVDSIIAKDLAALAHELEKLAQIGNDDG